MADKEATAPREVVILRRKGGDEEEGKKGGAWKIAFADFMTAMMAFFLVMWLINSSDKKTITQVATYFNPLKLTDKTTSERGVYDMTAEPKDKKEADDHKNPNAKGQTDKKPDAKEHPKQNPTESAGGRATPDSQDKARRFSEEELFSDPYGVLAKLALQALNPETRLGPGALKERDVRENRGEAWRDPFDPASWRPTRRSRNDTEFQSQDPGKAAAPPPAAAAPQSPPAPEAVVEVKPQSQPASPTETAVERAKAEAAAKDLAAEITKAVQAGSPTLPRPELTVEATPEGLLISLTDKSDFGMFAVGSAEPRPETVVLMEQVAKALASKPGAVVIRGHTDARPFRGGASDNWRLSTSRAHISQYMLVRGGLAERRIERVEGYADQKLRVPEDPMAAKNRRIEILLRAAT